MFDMIWARWFPPEASNYAGVVRQCNGPAGLGEINDEELNRIDEAIKSSALGGKEYVKFSYLCEMLPEPIRKYRKMIHEFIPEVIEQAYGKEKESLHVGGFIGALLGFKTGLVDDLPRNLCRDALELLFDPLGTVCDIIDSVMPNNPDNCVAQIMRAWQAGDDFSRGRIAGNITGQVAIIVASKKFSAKVTSGRALEAASAASEVGSAAGVAEAAGEAAAVAKEAQSAASVAKGAEAASKAASVAKEAQSAASVAKGAETASKAASVAKETQSAAKVAKGAETVAKSTAGAAKSAETVAKSAAEAAKNAETVAKGAKAASGAGAAAKEAKGVAETAKSVKTVSGTGTAEGVKGTAETTNHRSIKFSPVNPGPLETGVAESFRGSMYTKKVLLEDTVMYRVYGGKAGKVGRYLTRVPQGAGLQSQLDLALNPSWGNTTENVTKVVVPKGTTVYEGFAASQNIYDSLGNVIGELPGGGSQIYISDVMEGWFK